MYTPKGERCELSTPNIPPKLSTRAPDEDREASEEDRAHCYSTSVTLFASKQEAGGRSCLFPCRCRSCFRELPLTSTPGVSSPLWLSAPTPVRHVFFFPFYASLLSLLHLLHVGQPCRPAPPCSVPMHLQRGELSAHTPTYTRNTHSSGSFSSFKAVLYARCLNKRRFSPRAAGASK